MANREAVRQRSPEATTAPSHECDRHGLDPLPTLTPGTDLEIRVMAIPRKGSRLITVDGTNYRWSIRPRPTYSQAVAWRPLTFAVELAETPGQVLSVTTVLPRPDNWLGLRSEPVTPRIVEQTIRAARLAGWEPHRSGNAFKFDFRD